MPQHPRVQVPSIPLEVLKPGAAPTNAFVVTKPSGLIKIGKALSALSPEVSRLSNLLQERFEEKETLRAQKDVQEAVLKGARELKGAIDKKLIRPDQSSIYRAAAQAQFGRLAAQKLNSAIALDMIQGDLATSTDPADFDARIAEIHAEELEGLPTGDPFFSKGFVPQFTAIKENARRQFTAQAGGRLVQQTNDQLYTEQQNAVDVGNSFGASVKQIATTISEINTEAFQAGTAGSVVNQMTAKALTDLALRADNIDDAEFVLEVLEEVTGGSGRIAGIPDIAKIIQDTRDQINMKDQQDLRYKLWKADQDREEREDEIVNGFLEDVLNNPGNPLPIADIQQALIDNNSRDLALDMPALRQKLQSGKFPSNEPARRDRLVRIEMIDNPLDPDFVTAHTLTQDFLAEVISESDLALLKQDVVARDRILSGEDGERAANVHQVYREALGQIRVVFADDSGDYPAERKLAADAAQYELRQKWFAFMKTDASQAMDEEEINNWLAATSRRIVANNVSKYKVSNYNLPGGIPGIVVGDNKRVQWRDNEDLIGRPLLLQLRRLFMFADESGQTSVGIQSMDEIPLGVQRIFLGMGVETIADLTEFLQLQSTLLNVRDIKQ